MSRGTSRSRAVTGYVLLFVTALFWAGAWLTARVAAHDMAPLTVTWSRFVVAAAALVPAWLALERGRRPNLAGRDWATLFGMSLTGIIAYTILFMVGVAHAPASDGAVITPGLAGTSAMIIAFLFTGARPKSRAVAGALLAVTGAALVGWSALRAEGTGSHRLLGDLLFVASAAVWGAYTVLGRRLADRVSAITGILLASVLGVVLLTPVVILVDGVPRPGLWTRAGWINVVYLGLGATAIAFVTYYLTVKLIGIDRTAPGLGLVPLFGVLGSALFLGEQLTALHALGGALVIAGIVLPAVRRPRRATSP